MHIKGHLGNKPLETEFEFWTYKFKPSTPTSLSNVVGVTKGQTLIWRWTQNLSSLIYYEHNIILQYLNLTSEESLIDQKSGSH